MVPGACLGPVIILQASIESNVKNLAETRVLARASSFYIIFGASKCAINECIAILQGRACENHAFHGFCMPFRAKTVVK